ncbi:hypothetical protein E1287_35475 [Actinomadura sp. KC06]|uniref:CU044_5270 family protein n=1 Tax=Actinomadura sp. KC06 TaxID=2530369 RepID=UPI00105065C7|nr:CU044_5270 family protein [Actinomadura sp. KC06]TDD27022.1 hypothetical protein E1287_35475 [Actinomadura sp. KC06]
MDELKMLRDFGDRLDHGPEARSARQRRRLREVIEQEALARRRFGRRRVMIAGGATAALAAGAAVVLVMTPTSEIGGNPPPAQAEAVEVLDHAAAATPAQPPPRGDQYVFLETREVQQVTSVSGGKVTNRFPRSHTRTWLSVDGTRDGLSRSVIGRGTALEAWTRADCRATKPRDTVVHDPWIARPPSPARTFTQDCPPRPAYRATLPTDPGHMREYLYRNSHGNNPPDVQAFITVGDLLRTSMLPSKARAAMFKAATRIPGIAFVPHARDAAGRPGVAAALTHDGIRNELIFDPRTFAFLGERQVLVAPNDKTSLGLKPGTVLESTAVLRTAITDRPGQRP